MSSETSVETTSIDVCLAGLHTYTEQLVTLCTTGAELGALMSKALSGTTLIHKLQSVLNDLHNLANLEATQLQMKSMKGLNQQQQIQVLIKYIHRFMVLQQQFFQYGSEQFLQLIPKDEEMEELMTSQRKNTNLGNVASQEELDSVIDMLSRCPRGEPEPPRMVSYPPLMTNEGRQRSDSLLTDTSQRPAVITNATEKTNTWPFRPRGNQIEQMFATYDGFNHDLEYNQYLQAVKQASCHRSAANSLLYNVWSDTAANKPWPTVTNYTQKDNNWPSDTINQTTTTTKGWSTTAPEESSCSDESSSNGEIQQWMMGDCMRRRHSSGGEKKYEPTTKTDKEQKSTNTWPPKQPWSSPGGATGGDWPSEVHKPLSAQWSDPLTTKSLSVWEPGTFDSLGPVGVSPVERKHSLM